VRWAEKARPEAEFQMVSAVNLQVTREPADRNPRRDAEKTWLTAFYGLTDPPSAQSLPFCAEVPAIILTDS
jgi:hypothetical protein